MPRNYLIDTNVLLEIVLERAEAQAAENCLKLLCEYNEYVAWIAPHGLSTFYYLAKKRLGKVAILKVIHHLLQNIRLAPLDELYAIKATTYGMSDYEDALQAACAEMIGAGGIITLNGKDFKSSPVASISPSEFMKNHP